MVSSEDPWLHQQKPNCLNNVKINWARWSWVCRVKHFDTGKGLGKMTSSASDFQHFVRKCWQRSSISSLWAFLIILFVMWAQFKFSIIQNFQDWKLKWKGKGRAELRMEIMKLSRTVKLSNSEAKPTQNSPCYPDNWMQTDIFRLGACHRLRTSWGSQNVQMFLDFGSVSLGMAEVGWVAVVKLEWEPSGH